MARLGDFSDQAESYQRSRPGYPPALVDRLTERAGLRPGDAVADIGAGTGIFTGLLLERGFAVTAIEPSHAMSARAASLTSVTWRRGTFEDTGLPDESQKWVVAAQAFHWAELEHALPEMRRILEPGGQFSAIWNDRDNRRSEILTETMAALHRCVPEYDPDYRQRAWDRLLVSTGDFEAPRIDEEEHVVTMTHGAYLDLWRSNNRIVNFAGARLDAFLTEVESMLERLGAATVEIPYVCRAFSARRR